MGKSQEMLYRINVNYHCLCWTVLLYTGMSYSGVCHPELSELDSLLYNNANGTVFRSIQIMYCISVQFSGMIPLYSCIYYI